MNEAFNHWIVHRTPFVTVKAAMTLDGKIATASGESKWITGEKVARDRNEIAAGRGRDSGRDKYDFGRQSEFNFSTSKVQNPKSKAGKRLRRIILDSMARTPLNAKVVSDEFAKLTTIVVSKNAPKNRVAALAKRVKLFPLFAPTRFRQAESAYQIDLRWLLKKLGSENVTSLLVEGGGEVNASFLLGGFANRVAFFYAPKILGGRDSRKAVAGEGVRNLSESDSIREVEWKRIGEDLLMTAKVVTS